MLELGLHSKDRMSTKDKANIRNPKINIGCPPLTANRTPADCMQISLGSPIRYMPLRVYRTGGFNALNSCWCKEGTGELHKLALQWNDTRTAKSMRYNGMLSLSHWGLIIFIISTNYIVLSTTVSSHRPWLEETRIKGPIHSLHVGSLMWISNCTV